jgi:hypothetical protein
VDTTGAGNIPSGGMTWNTFNADTTLCISIPNTDAGVYSVFIINNDGCYSTSNFVDVEFPYNIRVTGFAPANGCTGDLVTIHGHGFLGTIDSVYFNTTKVTSYIIVNDSVITTHVPAGATSGPISVYTDVCSSSSNASFAITCTITANLKFFIQGYYLGGGTMTAPLNTGGLSANPTDCDVATVQLWSYDDGLTAPVFSTTDTLHTDGTMSVTFPGIVSGHGYFIVIRHMNAIETWSADTIHFTPVTTYDFTTAQSQAFGANQALMPDGTWAFWNGDIADPSTNCTQDGQIESADYSQLENDVQSFIFYYYCSDLTGDTQVESADYSQIENNVQLFIFLARP